ncbi:MAG: AEC family transporter [Clostridia bacterium]|nr:AEC family transporter [Clostridia bacterium]
MELSLIIMRKIVVMFLLVLVGYICARLGMIDEHTNKRLSTLTLKLVTPMLIFSSFQTEYDVRIVQNLLLSFAAAILAYLIQIPLGILLIRKTGNPDYRLERLSLIFSNCGFFGIPLIESLYGAEGAIYVTAFVTMFNILLWTVGDSIMSGRISGKSLLKGILSPVVAATVLGLSCLLLRIQVPQLIMEPVRSIAAMNTPFAMIVAGATLAGTNLLVCLKNKRTYWMLLCKMLLIPATAAVLLSFVPLDPMLISIAVIAVSCPVAAACPMFAVLYDQNTAYASQLFAVTTLCSIVTIPLIFTLSTFLTA